MPTWQLSFQPVAIGTVVESGPCTSYTDLPIPAHAFFEQPVLKHHLGQQLFQLHHLGAQGALAS